MTLPKWFWQRLDDQLFSKNTLCAHSSIPVQVKRPIWDTRPCSSESVPALHSALRWCWGHSGIIHSSHSSSRVGARPHQPRRAQPPPPCQHSNRILHRLLRAAPSGHPSILSRQCWKVRSQHFIILFVQDILQNLALIPWNRICDN